MCYLSDTEIHWLQSKLYTAGAVSNPAAERERLHTNDVCNKHNMLLIAQRSTKNYTVELRFSTESESEYVKKYQFNTNAVFIQVYFRKSVTYVHQFYSACLCFLEFFFILGISNFLELPCELG